MSRPIKFRAWDTEEKVMLLSESQEFILIPTSPTWGIDKHFKLKAITDLNDPWLTDVDCFDWASGYLLSGRYIPLQYTGLKDKNGKEIYEGDIVRFVDDAEGQLELIGQVYWDERQCQFAEKGTHEHDAGLSPFCDDYEVIGNIYENPELLKETL